MSNRAAVYDRTTILSQRLDALASELTELQSLRERVLRAEATKVSTRPPERRRFSALIAALEARTIAGAALDVFDIEPLPTNHPYRTLDNVFGTPHIGYGTSGLYRTFYQDCMSNIAAWIDEHLASHR